MKNRTIILSAAMLILASCSQNMRSSEASATTADTLSNDATLSAAATPLFAKMFMSQNVKTGSPVQLTFTVYNHTDTVQQFCKWHTPFEPLLSKYLDIADENGKEVMYKGPMAKRVMPPPADSYLKIQPKDSLSVTIDLLKGYAITKPSVYTLKYNGQNMSGLVVNDSVSFSYGK